MDLPPPIINQSATGTFGSLTEKLRIVPAGTSGYQSSNINGLAMRRVSLSVSSFVMYLPRSTMYVVENNLFRCSAGPEYLRPYCPLSSFFSRCPCPCPLLLRYLSLSLFLFSPHATFEILFRNERVLVSTISNAFDELCETSQCFFALLLCS